MDMQKAWAATAAWRKGSVAIRRALMVVAEYNKARERGEKHTAAMQAAVDFVRQHQPKMPISTTAAKRVLAEFRPRTANERSQ